MYVQEYLGTYLFSSRNIVETKAESHPLADLCDTLLMYRPVHSIDMPSHPPVQTRSSSDSSLVSPQRHLMKERNGRENVAYFEAFCQI